MNIMNFELARHDTITALSVGEMFLQTEKGRQHANKCGNCRVFLFTITLLVCTILHCTNSFMGFMLLSLLLGKAKWRKEYFFWKYKLYSQYISFLKNDFALQALHMYKELPFHSWEVIYLCNLWCGCRLHLSVQAPSWRPWLIVRLAKRRKWWV